MHILYMYLLVLAIPIQDTAEAREEIKYSPWAIILLIGMQIVDMKLLDEHLAKVSLI